MELEITPPVDEPLAEALAEALKAARAAARDERGAWQRAALEEAVERGEGYALSPRSTRGATRA